MPEIQKAYPPTFTKALKRAIRKRDKYTCQMCVVFAPKSGIRLHVHHIDYDKMNSSPDNLISLCRPCHARTNTNRKYWTQLFTAKLNRRNEK